MRSIITLLLFAAFSHFSFNNLSAENNTNLADSTKINILFFGNSFTGWNEMPEMLRELTNNTSHDIHVDKYLWYGGSLYEISLEDTVRTIINSLDWDFIILQDSPYRYAYPEDFSTSRPLNEALINLKEMIEANSSKTETILFMPWAYKDGQFWEEVDPDDYKQMQRKVYVNSIPLAKSFDFKIAPVGWAWDKIVDSEEGIELFQQDLTHPTIEGSYLTACVIYSTIFREEIKNNLYVSEIPKETAEYLQSVATQTVFGELENWNLITSISDQQPEYFELYQNYPNPFNSQTNISFNLFERSSVKITVYNSIGEKVKSLLSKELSKGNHIVLFEANLLANGIYYYSLEVGTSAGKSADMEGLSTYKAGSVTDGFVQTKKMVYLK